MNNNKDDIYYIKQIKIELDIIEDYINGLSFNEISNDTILCDAIMFRLIQLSEHTTNISNDFKETNKQIEWIQIKGFRNIVVHDYGTVDLDIVKQTLFYSLPELKKEINNILLIDRKI